MPHLSWTSDKVYELYYNDVGQHEILSPKEERELLSRYHTCPLCRKRLPQKVRVENCPKCGAIQEKKENGRITVCTTCYHKFETFCTPVCCPRCGSPRDMAAREKLIVSNLRFVVRRAKSMTNKPDYIKKLISAGNIGLMLAIDKFSLHRKTRFLTYAEWWIRKEMLDEIHASKLIHIPTHKQKSLRRELKEGKYVCVHCGMRTEYIQDVPFGMRCVAEEHDFILPVHNDAAVLSDALPVDNLVLASDHSFESSLMTADMEELLRSSLQRLPVSERDKFIVMGYFDVPNPDRKMEQKSLHQLAALTGITPERVRQIKEQTLQQLSKVLKRQGVTEVQQLC